ncbi:hypothetical protein AB0K00_30800 [Dactylosporangium sp. NPDC049525]|uniref:hypothetical protein n=1 Tax=Dactylosporangium sp. NPDC049525 TaxID=3154730 RepID=UPI0034409BFD
MGVLPLRFADEFRLAGDPQTLLIDFWSFLNASQSALDWSPAADRAWDHLEELELELEDGEPSTNWLAATAARWCAAADGSERALLRGEAGRMLAEALSTKGS